MRTGSSIVLKTEGLEIGYLDKGKRQRSVASGLNLSLSKGRFVCLLGPNGAGKSTLIRSLTGMQPCLNGVVEILGRPLETMSPKQRARSVSVVLTDRASLGLLEVSALVALGRHPHTNWTGMLSKHDRDRVAWALDAVGAIDLRYRLVTELSDGERQKVMIARALAQEASFIVLDEPTAFLDLPRRVELMRTLKDLAQREGLGILMSTHDLDLAIRCSDELWLLDDGGNLFTGMPETLALNGALAAVFASDKLDWDEEHGSFRMHRNACLMAQLIGEGAVASWTRRALARIGYGVTEDSCRCDLTISIERVGTDNEWRLEVPGKLSCRYRDLETLIAELEKAEWLKKPGNPVGT